MSSNDTLSHVLRSIRLRGAVFFYISCGAEWAAEAPPGAEVRASVMPGRAATESTTARALSPPWERAAAALQS